MKKGSNGLGQFVQSFSLLVLEKEREIVDCVCECVCLAVWYFLKEFPPTVRAEPPWAPQQSNPQTDPVLLPERKRERWQQYGVSLDVKVYKYKEALIKLLHTEN